jgi:hypothetical protein
MTTAVVPHPTSDRGPLLRLARAAVLTFVVDGLWAIVLTHLYGRSTSALWQGVATTAFGPTTSAQEPRSVALGLVVHFSVAFTWSAVLLVLVSRWRWLGDLLESPYGPIKIAVVWGPLIWIVMSAVVIPLRTGNPVVNSLRWWIQAAGHIVFVGLPMAWGARKR